MLSVSACVRGRGCKALKLGIPMVHMMLVRRKALWGLYSVLRLASHSTRVRPYSWWASEFAMVVLFFAGPTAMSAHGFSCSLDLSRQIAHLVTTPDQGQLCDVRDGGEERLIVERRGRCAKKKKGGGASAVKY